MVNNARFYISSIGDGESFLGFNKNKSPFIIVGIPLDISTSFRGGSSIAPERIRRVSRSLELCSIFTNIDIEHIGFNDIGNIILPPGDISLSLNRIESTIKELLNENKTLFLIGGEHTITLPSFKSFTYKSLAPCLLVFDAHIDLRDEYLGSKYNHATVMRRILEETNNRIILVGARSICREEIESFKKFRDRIDIIRIQGKHTPTIEVYKTIQKKLEECTSIYISIDMDILDPAYAPGVQTPEPIGIDPVTLLGFLDKVINEKIKVIDIVEVSPLFDKSDSTSFLAARIIIEIAAFIYRYIDKEYEKYLCKW